MTWLQPHYNFGLRTIVLLIGVALLSFSEILERVDLVFYDKVLSMQEYSPSNDVVIVAIDDISLQVLGRWPWSRKIHADFINRLAHRDNVIALDLFFTEPDENDLKSDELLAAAIATHGAVILPVAPISDTHLNVLSLAEPLSHLRDNAMLGHVDIELDRDGIARRVFLTAGFDTPKWPTFGLALASQASKLGETNRFTNLSDDDVRVTGDWVRSQEVLIPYVGPPGSFRQISYVQVLYDESVLADLSSKAIIVGVTAAGMGMRFATPVSTINRQPMNGTEWHANVFEMLQHDRAVLPVSSFNASLISVFWVLMALLIISFLSRDLTLPILLMLLVCGLFIVVFLLRWLHVWIPPSAAFFGTLAIYPLWNWRRINESMRSLFMVNVRSNVVLESVGDGVITTDAHDHVIYMNSGAEKILEVNLKQVQGLLLHSILHLRVGKESIYNELIEGELPIPEFSVSTIQCYLETSLGVQRAVSVTRHLLRDDKDELMGYVVAIADVTDTVELTQQMAHQASHDTLTKLPNRALLLSRFDQMAAEIQQKDSVITVLFVTLDNFRKINNALGHRAGDILLRMVSLRLFEAIGEDDMLARWGGDEFVLLFDYLQKNDMAPQMAQKILKIIEQPFELDEQEVLLLPVLVLAYTRKMVYVVKKY